jgi:hypothetical protein
MAGWPPPCPSRGRVASRRGVSRLTPPAQPTICPVQRAVVAQLVRVPACHAGGRGFEPRPPRQSLPSASRASGIACCRAGRQNGRCGAGPSRPGRLVAGFPASPCRGQSQPARPDHGADRAGIAQGSRTYEVSPWLWQVPAASDARGREVGNARKSHRDPTESGTRVHGGSRGRAARGLTRRHLGVRPPSRRTAAGVGSRHPDQSLPDGPDHRRDRPGAPGFFRNGDPVRTVPDTGDV